MEQFRLTCNECGSTDVMVGLPDTTDMEHPKLNYVCRRCGTPNKIDCKITGVSPEGKLQISVDVEPKILLA